MHDDNTESLRAAIAALEGQRAALGDKVLELTIEPLRARLAALHRPTGLQRRQVSVLFADIVGSTAMAGALDAEDTLEVLNGAMRRMATLVEAHQGRVLRFTGDGVKAAFGMDETREDDPARAVRAGLAMLQAGREQAEAARLAHGIADFALRVGVHTGYVALGAGIDADNTATGAAVHIAARMEQSAPPGALRISHDTFNHVRGLFDVEQQPPLLVKGVDEPLKTYLVRAALDRSGASVERGLQGLSIPMVGRAAELLRLRQATAQARETRQLRALTLVGDAGLGKSRLLREWRADLDGCRVITVRSQPDGMLRPWGLLRSLLAVQFAVADTDSAEVARRKVEDGLSPWFEERGQRQAQLIGQLSGLDFGDSPHLRGLDPRALRDQGLAALRGYLQGLAGGDAFPVLIVEDLHWADDGSLDLLQDLLAHAAELPLALVMTGRPALLTRRPEWGAAESIVQLSPLAPAQSDELAQALLQRVDEVPPKLTQLIVGRAEGNPYYMEELVRRLVDDGVIVVDDQHWSVQLERLHEHRLPGTLVGLLQARLDALPAGERLAVRRASVIGHVFWDDALQAVDHNAPEALPALQRAAFVRPHEASDFEGTAERQFDHHLLHQVTYDTLLKAERRLGHGAVARWLTERTRGRGPEFLAMTGEHAERAGEMELAIDCFEQAGKEAKKRFANAAARTYFHRALALLGESAPTRRIALLGALGEIADGVGDRAVQGATQRDIAAILERHPDDARQAALWMSMALLEDRLGDLKAAQRLAEQAFDLAVHVGYARTAALAQAEKAWLALQRDDDEDAKALIDVAMDWAGRMEPGEDRAFMEAQLLTLLAMVLHALDRFAEARDALLGVLSRGSPKAEVSALLFLGKIAVGFGQLGDAAIWAERALSLARSIGFAPRAAEALMLLGRIAAARGDHEAALRWLEECLAVGRSVCERVDEARGLAHMGRSHLELGDATTALRRFAEAQELHQDFGDLGEACDAAALAACCELRLGRPERALSAVNALLERLKNELAERPAHRTIEMRWNCRQVLVTLGDARAAPMLEQLFADVQARVATMVDAPDRDRLIEAVPEFRRVVTAYPGSGGAPTAAA